MLRRIPIIVNQWRNMSPLTGLYEMPLNEQRHMLKRRRRGIFVVIKPIKSLAPLGVIYSEYKKDAPVP